MKLILVEGPDNAGKTTLVGMLQQARPQARISSSPPAGSRSKAMNQAPSIEEMLEALREIGLAAEGDEDVIFDRSPLVSERVYGRTLGRGQRVGTDLMDAALWRIAANEPHVRGKVLPTTLIYCRPPTEVVLEFDEREQMEGVRENARALLRAYDDWYSIEAQRPLWRKAFTEIRIHDWTMDPGGLKLIADLRRGGLW